MTNECRITDEGYLLNGEHYDECEGGKCLGCFPCVPRSDSGDPLAHCTARHRCTNHIADHELTCPQCLAKTRGAMSEVLTMTGLLPEEAEEKGVDSEAANLAGPADPIGWSERKVHASANGYLHTLEDDDPHHPLAVLGRWDMMLREDYDQPTRERLTVASAVDYLDRTLYRFANDDEQDFPLFVRDVAACKAHMEAVLHDQVGGQRGAPCHLCSEPAPALQLRHNDQDFSGATDWWQCPQQREHRWTVGEYRLRVSTDYRAHADRLTAPDMRVQYRVPEASVRAWASKGEVRRRGRDDSGRQLYDVADVVKRRDRGEVDSVA